MPYLTIDYSSQLSGVLDREALLAELHPLVLEETGSAGVCKTFCRASEAYVGDGANTAEIFVHAEVGLVPGRHEALKAQLSESILALLARHLPPEIAARAFLSAEVRELAPSYRLSPTAAARQPVRA